MAEKAKQYNMKAAAASAYQPSACIEIISIENSGSEKRRNSLSAKGFAGGRSPGRNSECGSGTKNLAALAKKQRNRRQRQQWREHAKAAIMRRGASCAGAWASATRFYQNMALMALSTSRRGRRRRACAA